MKFDEHVWKGKGAITKNLKGKASIIRTLKQYLPFNLLCQVGNSTINSTILYCAQLWGPSSQGNRNKVQAAQIKAARMITGNWNKKDNIFHRQELLDRIRWPNVEQLVKASTLNTLKGAIEGKTSRGIREMFKITKPMEGSRRQVIRIDFKGNKKRSDNMFSTFASQTFNSLPDEIKHPSITTRNFKNKVKEHPAN